jgi:LuxR family maltose regulon positive regulatory protein
MVARPRLIEKLNGHLPGPGDAFARTLTNICAPAGFGKTTLIVEWLAQLGRPAAWLSLDNGDNDLGRFLGYVIACIQRVDPGVGRATQVILQGPEGADVEFLLTHLINDLTSLETPLVFVLDDYHVITLQAIHQAMAFWLDNMPPQLHLVIATREDPPIPLGRLRARGRMIELRAGDLRFTEEEISAFMKKTMNLRLSGTDIRALEERTEGWIAGLQLAALSLKEVPEEQVSGFIRDIAGSHRYVVEYLVEEVLKRRPSGTKSFLLQTSILDRLTGPLCDAVTNGSEGQETLRQLEDANLFLVPLDHARRWYRYHHLFADLLRNELVSSQADLLPTLHRRASTWLEENELFSEAIAHSLKAGDYDRAAELTELVFFSRMGHGEDYDTMFRRLAALPKSVLRARPRLGIMYAWMLSIVLQIDAVEPQLLEVERSAKGDLPADLQKQMILIRAAVARHRRKIDRSIEMLNQVRETLPEDLSPTDQQTLTGIAFYLALAYMAKGDLVQAESWFSQALTISQMAGSFHIILLALRGMALVQILGGKLNEAAETCRQGLALVDQATQNHGYVLAGSAYIYLAWGDLLRERNQLAKAARYLEQGLELGRRWRMDGETLRDGYISLACLRQAQRDEAGALGALQQADELAWKHQAMPGFELPIAACRAKLALVRARISQDVDSLNEVRTWAKHCKYTDKTAVITSIRTESVDDENQHLVWARLLLAESRINQSDSLLGQLLPAAEDGGRTGRVIEILALKALAQEALGDTAKALSTLERALVLAEPEGYVRLFVDEGWPMGALLCKAVSRGIAPAYASELLAAVGMSPEGAPTTAPAGAAELPDLPLDPLSSRELEVLHLLSTDLTGPEIAAELVVSVNTIKTHIKRIYNKLDAHSRYEALAKAKEIGLL